MFKDFVREKYSYRAEIYILDQINWENRTEKFLEEKPL